MPVTLHEYSLIYPFRSTEEDSFMFQLNHVTKTYEKRQRSVLAFRADRLEIDPGEYVAVVGPSGSGKTTLLSILGGMLSPDSGEVRFDGDSLYSLSVNERTKRRCERIGFVFQTFNLVPYLTAVENVALPLYLRGADSSDHSSRAKELLDKVGLANRVDHKPCELSTGQQQRVALARTLANDPRVILADEPTGNLDPDSREVVLSMFEDFVSEGGTIVMVTHDIAAAQRAGRRLNLRDGEIADARPQRRCA